MRRVHPPEPEHANQRRRRLGLDRLIAGLQYRSVIIGRSTGQGVGPAPAPVTVPFLIADLEAVDVAVAIATVIAGGEHPGKRAHLGRTGKEVHPVADLRFPEAGSVLDRHSDVHTGRGGGRHIGVQAREVVNAGRRLHRRPVPLQPSPFHARGRDPPLIAPDRKPVGIRVILGHAGQCQDHQEQADSSRAENLTSSQFDPSSKPPGGGSRSDYAAGVLRRLPRAGHNRWAMRNGFRKTVREPRPQVRPDRARKRHESGTRIWRACQPRGNLATGTLQRGDS